jgi:spore coat protein U-like protein
MFGSRIGLSLAVCSVLCAANQASAATVTTNIVATVTVSSTCTVSAVALVFGAYNVLSVAPTVGTSTLTVQCTQTTPYHIQMNQGSYGASVTTREMSNGSSGFLQYAIYQDSARTLNWGQTNGVDTVNSTGTGLAQVFTMYGQMPALQIAAAGSYSDTVTVTVSF